MYMDGWGLRWAHERYTIEIEGPVAPPNSAPLQHAQRRNPPAQCVISLIHVYDYNEAIISPRSIHVSSHFFSFFTMCHGKRLHHEAPASNYYSLSPHAVDSPFPPPIHPSSPSFPQCTRSISPFSFSFFLPLLCLACPHHPLLCLAEPCAVHPPVLVLYMPQTGAAAAMDAATTRPARHAMPPTTPPCLPLPNIQPRPPPMSTDVRIVALRLSFLVVLALAALGVVQLILLCAAKGGA